MRAQLGTQRHWPGARNAFALVEGADARAESAGESLARYLFAALGLPVPELQLRFRDDDSGREIARCDFGWESFRTVGEFDGRLKYHRAGPGRSPTAVVIAEKKREEWLRTTKGYLMIRLTWTDLYPDRYAAVYEAVVKTFRDATRLNGLPSPELPERYPGPADSSPS